MRISDWSSDVCSSDLVGAEAVLGHVDDLGSGVGVLDLDDVDVGRAEAGDLVGGAGRLDGGAVDGRGRGPRAVDLERPEVAGALGGGLDRKSTRLNSSH